MTAASTPGPWKAHFEEAHFVIGPDLGRVAMMMNLKGAHGLGGRRSGAESAANCRLIAAAPDLLGALQVCASHIIDRGADGRPLSKAAQVRMCGNSVCPPLAEALVRANYSERQALRAAA